MSYSDKVIDHYHHPRNVGSMDTSNADVGTGLVGVAGVRRRDEGTDQGQNGH
jgi:NifU-like protein involved in Fe-S cluster formation